MSNGNGGIIIKYHGVTQAVTGFCHELVISEFSSLLIDYGLFLGEKSRRSLNIELDIQVISALIITHCHIYYVGRVSSLLATSLSKLINCTPATT